MTPLVLVVLLGFSPQDPASPRVDCRQPQECRQLAQDAAARGDFEAFHDLAWRAVQTGPKNDPDLLYLLARAQSLSGRPGDALVMLQRLARMGVRTDAATNEDFRRVRALPGWPETEALLNGTPPVDTSQPDSRALTAAPPASTPPRRPAAAAPAPAVEVPPKKRAAEPATAPPAAAPPPPAAAPPTAVTPPPAPTNAKPGTVPAVEMRSAPTESLRFTTAPFTPAGLAYDGVSRRFIVGDRLVRKLAVVDEFSHHVANLASAQSTGFGDIAALEIDPRLGNLWVVSNEAATRGPDGGDRTGAEGRSTLHKLQLVSGRVLASYNVANRLGAARLADVAITTNGTVLVLDTAGHRLLRLAAQGESLEMAAPLPDTMPTSIAPASSDLVYVANETGIVAVNLSTRRSAALKTGKDVDISRIARFRWYKGALVALQQTDDGTYRAIRVVVGRNGTTATAVTVLDPSLANPAPDAATISGGTFYYLAGGDGAEMIVRKISLP
jgi:hypothetical protein